MKHKLTHNLVSQHSLRRRLLNAQEETSEWLYEAYLTDSGTGTASGARLSYST